MKNWQRDQMPTKWRGKGREEDRECDWKPELREVWKEWENKGEQQRKTEGVGDC